MLFTESYLAELEGFFAGFVVLAESCLKKGMDLPNYLTYFRKKDLKYIVDKPVLYSELCKGGGTKKEITLRLVERCNQLGKMQFNDDMIVTEEEQTKITA